ncbi:hypothetical protein BABINDRAFT_143760 [Babjeviella inositovora NRRL Y-12698]|uniref:Uncharacterized protein n=1 Tax=Babjeviella inositovora NRRL Y-12698 TaxID=984486 RepID=A0A1E3QP93_9ASCO|nr:uncharacterized protein BABINDRAFT_143760 [Babjeviella inositovora NRRL Y-12698]ODQ79505.1 hypothetical protein BABINDRAFT_143760 [Babjeviella inositovora NRRL Y-12698]
MLFTQIDIQLIKSFPDWVKRGPDIQSKQRCSILVSLFSFWLSSPLIICLKPLKYIPPYKPLRNYADVIVSILCVIIPHIISQP